MSREIQPLNEDSRRLDSVYLPGKHGGQYMMERQAEKHTWVVRARIGTDDEVEPRPWYRIGAWEESTARKILDYCVQNDVSMRAAVGNMYLRGEPDLLMDLVEKAKAEPTYRLRRAKWDFHIEFSYRDGQDMTYWPAEIDAMIKNYIKSKGVERVYNA